jgi:hypothetical protein
MVHPPSSSLIEDGFQKYCQDVPLLPHPPPPPPKKKKNEQLSKNLFPTKQRLPPIYLCDPQTINAFLKENSTQIHHIYTERKVLF